MMASYSDALVFFGATGDLAYKKIFPALQAMLKRGNPEIPIIGVAKAGWNVDQLRARARESVERHGGLDRDAFDKLSRLLRYVDGDYHTDSTFQELRKQLGDAKRPAFYLAIPPALFELVIEQLGKAACSKGARVIVEKPFGTDLASARELNRILLGTFPESAIFRIDHYLGEQPVRNLLYFRFADLFSDVLWNRANVESVQITMAEDFGVQGRGARLHEIEVSAAIKRLGEPPRRATNQPRTLRMSCSRVHWRFSGGVTGPATESSSGYCGNTGSGSVAPLGCGTASGWAAECNSRSLMDTSIRNVG
jgi:glucose-6-phosphate 1-dehydrogenase